jgi:hypothetical protein
MIVENNCEGKKYMYFISVLTASGKKHIPVSRRLSGYLMPVYQLHKLFVSCYEGIRERERGW